MNEQEWLTSEDPMAMLLFSHASLRKLRLFACAYCRAKGVASDLVDRLERYGSDDFESDGRWAAAIMEDRTTEPGLLASLLHEVVGNPIQPVLVHRLVETRKPKDTPGRENFVFGELKVVAPDWLTPAVVGMARHAYDARDFSNLPVLADALEEAGCDNVTLLEHLRGSPSGPHVRGCWALDLILGKG